MSASAMADITGKVKLDGKPPEMKDIDMSGVKECASQHPDPVADPTVVADDKGDLANVIVSIKKEEGKDLPGEAPKEGAVISITHCGDTYTVKTADGKVNRAWEFNLRFKTDSSALGPLVGKPVIVGAGMQGDRASVVFAAPNEIGSFIKESCQ